MSFLDKLPKPFFVLAPMDDVTDTVFRQIVAELPYPERLDEAQGGAEQHSESYMEYDERAVEAPTQRIAKSTDRVAGSAGKQSSTARRYGPDLYFTEFVNVDGLQSPGRQKLLHKLKFSGKEKPIIAQLWGLKPENFYKTTKEIIEMGFDGVDLNMGCPVKTVIKNGACAALINNRQLAEEIIDATKEAAHSTSSGQAGNDFPVSVKTRPGFGEVDMSWIEFLLSKKLDMLSIHGRTAKEQSSVPAKWELVGQARQMRDKLCPATKIVGNGDVMSLQEAQKLAGDYQLDGVMIGRGVFRDPFIFSKDSPWGNFTKQQKIELYRRHIELFGDTWQKNERRIETLNKFCKVYINGFDGAKELREKLMSCHSAKELLATLHSA